MLISLLNAILRRESARQITDVSILEDTKLARELVEDKEAVLDILCEIDGREKVNVEMQVRRFVRMDYRSLFYVGKLLTESLHYGEPYDCMQRSIGINILGSCPLTSMIRCIAGCGFWNRRPLPNNWRS